MLKMKNAFGYTCYNFESIELIEVR